jgi:quercetin dioxygenase-like cupin family protein
MMADESRRTFLGATLAAVAGLRGAAQPAGAPPVQELARHALTGAQSGFDAVLVELTVAAGAPAGAPHRHPGFVLGYVLEGDLRFAINGQPPHVVSAGRSFFEPAGALHSAGGSAAPGRPVRFLAFMVVPSGSALSLPA